jgi:hypothetical protein
MVQNFRKKNVKDIEASLETIISSEGLTRSILNNANSSGILAHLSERQDGNESWDNVIEKRK